MRQKVKLPATVRTSEPLTRGADTRGHDWKGNKLNSEPGEQNYCKYFVLQIFFRVTYFNAALHSDSVISQD